ncbi:MAG: glycosyl hydrolase family 28-related protein [Anaerolineales bacterium]
MPQILSRVCHFLLLTGLLLTGCVGTSVETPTASPAPSATALPSPLPATATKEVVAARIFPVVRIKNAETETYLYEKDGQAQLGDVPASDESSHWTMEDYQGSKRFQNRASSNYLSIEHLQPYVEVIPIYPDWMSPRWTLDGDPSQGSVAIRNVWHNWQFLYVEDGRVKYERVPSTEDNARWFLEPGEGFALAAHTPTAMVAIPTASNPPGSRGAAVPWTEYEAEDGGTNGEFLGPDRTFGTIPAESSGRRAVKLDQAGEYVQVRSMESANSVVVRFVIPDSEDGQGLETTLSLYVNDVFRQKIQLTSKYAWSYGGEEETFNVPKAGGAHHFYDEARALVGDIPAGATVKLQKDADDAAEYYVIDLIDLEQVPRPKLTPQGYLSIVEDCGAVPDDGRDDGPAIQACIARARTAKTGVWIPVGTFESTSHPFEVSDVTIQGAGMWYSTLHGFYARFNCIGNNCRYFDFAILGETVLRDDKSPENGFNGGAGTGSRLENIWVEHTKVGYWVGRGTNGLVITGSRFRNLFADGVNFCNGTSNSLIENSHFRNTGDDALASWSPQGDPVNTNNFFRFNTVQIPWRANCFAIYGGRDNRIEDNLCFDVVTYPGILIAQHFNSNPFEGATIVQRNSLIRAGGPMFHLEHGALKVWASQGEIRGLTVRDLLIDSPTFSGIELQGNYPITGATIENVTIQGAGTSGIHLASSLQGDVTFSFVVVVDSGKEAITNYAPKLKFELIPGDGNQGW